MWKAGGKVSAVTSCQSRTSLLPANPFSARTAITMTMSNYLFKELKEPKNFELEKPPQGQGKCRLLPQIVGKLIFAQNLNECRKAKEQRQAEFTPRLVP